HARVGDLFLYGSHRCITCAIDQYQLIMRNHRGTVDNSVHLHLAQALLWTQHYEEALSILRANSHFTEADGPADELYAEALLTLGKLDEAEHFARLSTSVNAKSAGAWYLSVLIVTKLGCPHSTQLDFERALHLDPRLA